MEPTYPGPDGQRKAIDYAVGCRFGGSSGEVHVYDGEGKKVVRVIKVDGGSIALPHRQILSDESL